MLFRSDEFDTAARSDDDNLEGLDEYYGGDGRKHQKPKSKCVSCLSGLCKFVTFILSRAGLISLVVLYCLLGAVTFENLERNYEIAVSRFVKGFSGWNFIGNTCTGQEEYEQSPKCGLGVFVGDDRPKFDDKG